MSSGIKRAARCAGIGILAAAAAWAADDPALQPVTVCEVFQDLAAYGGKTVVVLGRFSFRSTGRTLSQVKCRQEQGASANGVLDVVFDSKTAPKPAGTLSMDAPAVYKKLREIKTTTQLAKIPFGSPDYDRWAFVYGRVEESPAPNGNGKAGTKQAPPAAKRATIVCSGEALVVFLTEQ